MRQAKNITIFSTAVLVLIVLLVIANNLLSKYDMRARVVEIVGNKVTCECNGELWQFYDTEWDYGKYDFIDLVMDDNHTENDIRDDYILKVNGREVQKMQAHCDTGYN